MPRSPMPPPPDATPRRVPPAAIMLPPTSDSNNAVRVARMPRVNKAIELLEAGQPIYYELRDAIGAGGYDGGRAAAQTWADYITYDMEHTPFDVGGLTEFMRRLGDGGPTPSGHRTPPAPGAPPAADVSA